MAKSTRSKVKRSFRHKKREEGVYAATEAARLNRLNTKLQQVIQKDVDADIMAEDVNGEEQDIPVHGSDKSTPPSDVMAIDGEIQTRISTHGPRGTRREEWRKSKGLPARPSSHGMNRQGGVAARRKAGRSKRRR
ncbi:hypothetical protein BDQ17DRAFT_1323263 [Cyathus striatus]|nr:hypothetical protein BDQ17DRAFT_1323263 [Cyathus striatus]